MSLLMVPSPLPGRQIDELPNDVGELYAEARHSAGSGAYTASVLVCRKMLIDIAVALGDTYERGKPFIKYVDYITTNVFAPPHGKDWLDRIREQGNNATHELGVQAGSDAMLLITFVEMLLRLLYEFPEMLSAQTLTAIAQSVPDEEAEPIRGAGPDPRPAYPAGQLK